MKLPKFIKNSTHQERQQNLLKSNRQLMLTDNLYKFQPQKSKCLNTPQLALVKDIISTETKTPCTPLNDLYQIKTNKFNESTTTTGFSCSNIQTSGRYVKSAQPKRLQRNRLQQYQTQKPIDYNFRSSDSIQTHNSTPLTPVYYNSINNSNGRRLNPNEEIENKENEQHIQTPQTPVIKKSFTNLAIFSTVASVSSTSSSSKKEESTPTSTNRFSFSKLTKFVSRSALKVINGRKSIGASPSSADTSSSSSMSTDDEPELIYNKNIYKSYEQQKQIEEIINKQVSRPITRYGNSFNQQPSMGITSTMVKQLKRKTNNQYGLTTGITSIPNSYFVSVPIVFKTEDLKPEQNEPTYDRLNREPLPFLGDERKVGKKMTKPIVKSLTSIPTAALTGLNSTNKLKSSTNLTSPNLPTNSCRISVYSSSKLIQSTKLEQQLHYESFSEAVF